MCEGNNNSVQWKRCGCECYKTKACCDECCGGDIHNIGNGCLLSNNIELHTSDYHSILDIKSTTRINSAKNIHLGDRVWIGLRSIILKGTNLPNNDTIVGAGSIVTGHFNNKEQFEEMQKSGRVYPYAEHVNTVCNDKIKNLPVDFQGKFLVEESYYETNGKKHASSHIFLFTEEKEGILLSSYEIPAGADKLSLIHI